ncbi:MAG: amidohydrolase family protein [Clostridiales bacterium]|nr:amidohydrolase family protein [Clostridiales bacterium]
MVFGLFKKRETADVILKGGNIYTLNPDAPWAEAVACKDGRIMAVGELKEIESLAGNNTEVIDLENGTLFPGFMDTCGHPVLQSFQNACLILDEDMSQEEVLAALAAYIEANPDNAAYFAYGFNAAFVRNKPKEELQEVLDKICADKPITLLDISGFDGWFNTNAIDQVKAAVAEEEEPPIVTLPYVLHVLSPIDFDQVQASVLNLAAEYCQKGYTTVFDCGAPDYLHTIYQEIIIEMLQEEMLKQRFCGSVLVTRNVSADYVFKKLLQKRTSCVETAEYINCNVLKLMIDDTAIAEEDNLKITPDALKAFVAQAADQGFDIHIDATGKSAVLSAFEAAALARAAGNRKSHVTIAHDCALSAEEKMELHIDNELCEIAPTLGDFNQKYRGIESAENVNDAIEKLTIDAALQLGISDDFGSVEVGKYADFVLFENNPLDCDLPTFRGLPAKMTVIGGEVVYNAKEDRPEDWNEILKERQQEHIIE